MSQTIYKVVSLAAVALMLGILWVFQLVWVRPGDTGPMVMSGDAMAVSILNPVAGDDLPLTQAYVNAFWTKHPDASANCPVVRINSDQIDRVITRIGQLHLTEAEADRAAVQDIANKVARVYLPAAGAGKRVCAFAAAMKMKGIQVTLLNSMPRDTYGYQYVQRYNSVTMRLTEAIAG